MSHPADEVPMPPRLAARPRDLAALPPARQEGGGPVTEHEPHMADIIKSEHLAILVAEKLAFFYWGDDKEKIRERLSLQRIVLIGANLDTEVWWLRPDKFPETYRKLCAIDCDHSPEFIFVDEQLAMSQPSAEAPDRVTPASPDLDNEGAAS